MRIDASIIVYRNERIPQVEHIVDVNKMIDSQITEALHDLIKGLGEHFDATA